MLDQLVALKPVGALFAPIDFFTRIETLTQEASSEIKDYLIALVQNIPQHNKTALSLKESCAAIIAGGLTETAFLSHIKNISQFLLHSHGAYPNGLSSASHPATFQQLQEKLSVSYASADIARFTQMAITFTQEMLAIIAKNKFPNKDFIHADVSAHATVYLHLLSVIAPQEIEARLENALACITDYKNKLRANLGEDLNAETYPCAAQIILFKYWHDLNQRNVLRAETPYLTLSEASARLWGNKNNELLQALKHPGFNIFVLKYMLTVKGKLDPEENISDKLTLQLSSEKLKEHALCNQLNLPKTMVLNLAWVLQHTIYYQQAQLVYGVDQELTQSTWLNKIPILGATLDHDLRQLGIALAVTIPLMAEVYAAQYNLPSYSITQLINQLWLRNPEKILPLCAALNIEPQTYLDYLPYLETTIRYASFVAQQYYLHASGFSLLDTTQFFLIIQAIEYALTLLMRNTALEKSLSVRVGVHYLSAWLGSSLYQGIKDYQQEAIPDAQYLRRDDLCLSSERVPNAACKKAAFSYLNIHSKEEAVVLCKKPDVLKKGVNEDPLILRACEITGGLRRRQVSVYK